MCVCVYIYIYVYIYVYIYAYIYIYICEEKLTTSNPNRKGRFIEKQNRHYSVSVLLNHHQSYQGLLMLSIDGCIKSVKIYKNLEKLNNKKSWLFMTRKIGRSINESAFVSLRYVT